MTDRYCVPTSLPWRFALWCRAWKRTFPARAGIQGPSDRASPSQRKQDRYPGKDRATSWISHLAAHVTLAHFDDRSELHEHRLEALEPSNAEGANRYICSDVSARKFSLSLDIYWNSY